MNDCDQNKDQRDHDYKSVTLQRLIQLKKDLKQIRENLIQIKEEAFRLEKELNYSQKRQEEKLRKNSIIKHGPCIVTLPDGTVKRFFTRHYLQTIVETYEQKIEHRGDYLIRKSSKGPENVLYFEIRKEN